MERTSHLDVPDTVDIRNFKSEVLDIHSRIDIEDILFLPLIYQNLFDKKTSPEERKEWNEENLKSFSIDVNKIDHLYHLVLSEAVPNYRKWELSCRMKHDRQDYFVVMNAECVFSDGPDGQGYGCISFTKLPRFFMNYMVTLDQGLEKIYQALKNDKYEVELPDCQHHGDTKDWKNAPMLIYLCHLSIYNNKEMLIHFKRILPKLLANSVEEFIAIKKWQQE